MFSAASGFLLPAWMICISLTDMTAQMEPEADGLVSEGKCWQGSWEGVEQGAYECVPSKGKNSLGGTHDRIEEW